MTVTPARLIVLTALMGLAAWSTAQTGGSAKQQSRPALSQSVLTVGDASKALRKVERSLIGVLKLQAEPKALPSKDLDKPAQREYIVLQFARMVDLAKGQFKVTPRPIPLDPKTVKLSGNAKTALDRLVAGGFVASAGPLATGAKDTLTLHQFGDAVGLLIARIADLTHTPDSKYSPYLQGGG